MRIIKREKLFLLTIISVAILLAVVLSASSVSAVEGDVVEVERTDKHYGGTFIRDDENPRKFIKGNNPTFSFTEAQLDGLIANGEAKVIGGEIVGSSTSEPIAPKQAIQNARESAKSESPLDLIMSILSFEKLAERFDIFKFWLAGGPKTPDDTKSFGSTLRYLILMLVLVLFYSAFKYVNFPSNVLLRAFVTLIAGLLATMFISTDELMTTLTSYTALGVTLTLFFPILILLFFSMVVADKSSPLGIYAQKIMWAIYAGYLFVKSAILLTITYYCQLTSDGLSYEFIKQPPSWFMSMVLKMPILNSGEGISLESQAKTFAIVKSALDNDQIILWVLLIAAIAILFIMVFGNEYVEGWIQKEKLKAAIEAKRNEIAYAEASRKLEGEAMKKPGGGA